ncbi:MULTISPECIES: hypothetical protein [Rhizobium]|uniref:hypothetical protein n=1 Tax=Rhizobium TaxID=379 RepID=UPI00114CC352|nr:hypothetical protein [Rhizobium lusitanum]
MKYIPFCEESGEYTGVAHDPVDAPIFLSISNCCRGSQWWHCSKPVHSQFAQGLENHNEQAGLDMLDALKRIKWYPGMANDNHEPGNNSSAA